MIRAPFRSLLSLAISSVFAAARVAAPSGGGGAPPSMVSSGTSQPGFGAAQPAPVPAGAATGDRILLIFTATAAITSVTDDGGTSYSALAPIGLGTDEFVYLSDAIGATVPTTITLSSAGAWFEKCDVFVLRNVSATMSSSGALSTGFSTGPRSHAYTTGAANEFVAGLINFTGGSLTGVDSADADHTWFLRSGSGGQHTFATIRAAAGSYGATLAPVGAGSGSAGFWFSLEASASGGPPPQSGDITMSLVPSRTSGPAPLAVHFSAVGTTSTLAGVTDPFRQLLYTFDYGDTGAGTWPISGGSKNADASGPLGAHVFETPGTYVVRCTASRGADSSHDEVTITVTDPDVVYAGADTVFVSPSANYAGAPSGALTVTSIPTIVSGKRYMLRPGESFGALNVPHAVVGTQVVAAPVAGAKPIVSQIQVGEAGGPPNSSFPEDVTIEGLQCNGEVTQTAAIRRFLLKDVDLPSGFNITLGSALGYWADPTRFGPTMPHLREIFLVGLYGRGNTSTMGLTGDLIQSAVLGCDLQSSAQHTARFWRGYQAVISHNAMRGTSSDGIRHSLKMHSSGTGTFVLGSTIGDGDTWATRYVVCYRNLLSDAADNNAFAMVFGPQNGSSAEPLEDVIAEENVFARGSGFTSDLQMAGRRMTYIGNTQLVGGAPAAVDAPGLHSAGLPEGWDSPYFSSRT